MSAHGTDSHDPEAAMDPPSVNGHALKNGRSTSNSRSPHSTKSDPDMPPKNEPEEKIGGNIVIKQEPGQPPKIARSASQKVVPRPPQLFAHLPDSTKEALATFEQITECIYANKNMGYTEHAMDCDCDEEWDPETEQNVACGEYSDCINRATKIECVGRTRGCGPNCQNQRFQNKQYAPVAVIKTEKKGFGLRAEANLEPGQLIFEYVGEVVAEPAFRRRMRQYDEEGIKHFYFMSLNQGEFVDATKRGNLGRFCNHSCNPNCYVDKWVVGEKLRMGIFAERAVQAGEELVFNYNVDRYGADPQPCYCGEPNCTGFIGGRTQTERGTKLSSGLADALGIDDDEAWDTVVARRPKKKSKTEEADEEYVDKVQPKSLHEDGVTKVMAALMQCQEKWIAVKLLGRLQQCEDERVRHRVVKMHGYRILNSQLTTWKEDPNVVLQILDILDHFPKMTRNKIIDSKIESNILPLTNSAEERVAKRAAQLLASWANLEVGYRIPRMQRDEATKQPVNRFDRRDRGSEQRQRSVTRSPSPAFEAQHRPNQPRGPRNPQNRPRTSRRNRQPNKQDDKDLPAGWYSAADDAGRLYFYTQKGETTWTKPTAPAVHNSTVKKNLALQNIIDGIVNSQEQTPSEHKTTPGTPMPSEQPEKKRKMDTDYNKGRVQDPTQIDKKHEERVKRYCKEFFDKAAAKHKEREKYLAEKKRRQQSSTASPSANATPGDNANVQMSDADPATADSTAISPDDPASLKRKRSTGDEDSKMEDDADTDPSPPTPPPPPKELPGASGPGGKLLDADSTMEDLQQQQQQQQTSHIGIESV
ncbi:hypothetical protein N7470_000756 [Penicillium chermesinum]|nr:hypothetical protein N7470_000756 [Penicillium chermesinum]